MRGMMLALLLLVSLVAVAPAHAQDDGDPDDRIVLSGPVEVKAGEAVNDVVVFDGPVSVSGTVDGDVVAFSGPVEVSGNVTGDVVALSERVTLERGARIDGDLMYRGDQPVVPEGATVAGEVQKLDLGEFADPIKVAAPIVLWLAFSVSSLVLGLLLLWLGPRAADAAYETARSRLGPAIGWGLALFFGVPIAAIVALVTLVGIPLGVGLFLALLPLYAVGYTTSAWLLGRALVRPPRGRVLAFLAGWGILRLVALVPFLGGLVWFAATVFGLGALVVTAWRARSAPVPATTPAGA